VDLVCEVKVKKIIILKVTIYKLDPAAPFRSQIYKINVFFLSIVDFMAHAKPQKKVMQRKRSFFSHKFVQSYTNSETDYLNNFLLFGLMTPIDVIDN
jgi:hypothetical protein